MIKKNYCNNSIKNTMRHTNLYIYICSYKGEYPCFFVVVDVMTICSYSIYHVR